MREREAKKKAKVREKRATEMSLRLLKQGHLSIGRLMIKYCDDYQVPIVDSDSLTVPGPAELKAK